MVIKIDKVASLSLRSLTGHLFSASDPLLFSEKEEIKWKDSNFEHTLYDCVDFRISFFLFIGSSETLAFCSPQKGTLRKKKHATD